MHSTNTSVSTLIVLSLIQYIYHKGIQCIRNAFIIINASTSIDSLLSAFSPKVLTRRTREAGSIWGAPVIACCAVLTGCLARVGHLACWTCLKAKTEGNQYTGKHQQSVMHKEVKPNGILLYNMVTQNTKNEALIWIHCGFYLCVCWVEGGRVVCFSVWCFVWVVWVELCCTRV